MSRKSDKAKVRRALRKGKKFAKTADELQAETGIENSRTQEPIRALIRELIKDGLPIGSLPECGYWVIENEVELKEVINSLRSRTRGIDNRISEVRKAFRNFYNKN